MSIQRFVRVVVLVGGGRNHNKMMRELEMAGIVIGGIAVSATLTPLVVLGGLQVAGSGAGGSIAGSLAASIQGPAVVAGSAFATVQLMGATALLTSSVASGVGAGVGAGGGLNLKKHD